MAREPNMRKTPSKTYFVKFKLIKYLTGKIMREIKRGDPEEIMEWFDGMPKDEEFAKLLDEIVEKTRKEMKLDNDFILI
jgi:hypothetical protein